MEEHWPSSLEDQINERWEVDTKVTNEVGTKWMGVGNFPMRLEEKCQVIVGVEAMCQDWRICYNETAYGIPMQNRIVIS